MYSVARFGPIEVGRVTTIPGPLPYFVTVNAVAVKCPAAGVCQQQLPESAFQRAFSDYYEARAYATSFFPLDTQGFIEWTIYR